MDETQDMSKELTKVLVPYLAYLREQGFITLHASDVLPSPRPLPGRGMWSQFPVLDSNMLESAGITYNKYNGWFTLDQSKKPAL